jgi:hypothetical protein
MVMEIGRVLVEEICMVKDNVHFLKVNSLVHLAPILCENANLPGGERNKVLLYGDC